MEISKKDEYKHIKSLMDMSSVKPEMANQRYHIIAMDWFKRWHEFVTSSSED